MAVRCDKLTVVHTGGPDMGHEKVLQGTRRCMGTLSDPLVRAHAARVCRSRCGKHPTQPLEPADARQRDAEVVVEDARPILGKVL